jgi:hypothetical protein
MVLVIIKYKKGGGILNYLKINPFIRYAGQHTYHYNKRENSVCYDCRLFYIEQGKGTFFTNGQTHLISGNEAIFLPPESVYRFSFSNPGAIKIFILNLDLTDEFSAYSKSFSTATEETFDKTLTLKYDLPSEFQTPIVWAIVSAAIGVFFCAYIHHLLPLFLFMTVSLLLLLWSHGVEYKNGFSFSPSDRKLLLLLGGGFGLFGLSSLIRAIRTACVQHAFSAGWILAPIVFALCAMEIYCFQKSRPATPQNEIESSSAQASWGSPFFPFS